jgi:hypothetical protein
MKNFLVFTCILIPGFVFAGPFLSISTYDDLGIGITHGNSSYFAEVGWNGKYSISQVNVTGSNLTTQPSAMGDFVFNLDVGFSYIFSKKYLDAYTNIIIGTSFPYTLTKDDISLSLQPILGIGIGKNISDHFRLSVEYNIATSYSYMSYRNDVENSKSNSFTYAQKPRIKAFYLF